MAQDHLKTPSWPQKGLYKTQQIKNLKVRAKPAKEKRALSTPSNHQGLEPVFLLIQARSPYLTPGGGVAEGGEGGNQAYLTRGGQQQVVLAQCDVPAS